jgi:hypothetical protein
MSGTMAVGTVIPPLMLQMNRCEEMKLGYILGTKRRNI